MGHIRSRFAITALVAATSVLILTAACAPASETTDQSAADDTAAAADDTPIRIGVLPIIDAVPFYAAEEDGLFTDAGLKVEIIPFSSALERNVALQAGEIDGQLADLIATGLLNNEEHRVTIVKTLYRANDRIAMISLVAGEDSGIASAADLRGVEIGISHNSLIEYHLDQYLDEAGIPRDAVEKQEVPSIPIRMDLLSQGQLAAAVLPEPLTTLAVSAGGRVILDDKESRLGLSVLEFRTDFLSDHADLVRRVVAIHDVAVRRINASPSSYQHLLSEKARLPDVLKETFSMPPFPVSDVPAPPEIERANRWLVEKGLIAETRPYADWVDASFLPVTTSGSSEPAY